MKKTTLAMVMTLIATSSCLPIASFADDHGGGPQDQQWHQKGHEGQRGHEGPQGHDGHGGPQHGNFHGRERDHFAANGHDFRRGRPLPPEYRNEHYRVHDWRQRGLYEPPRGEQWAYVNGNYVLVAVATGIITSILIGNALNN
ncbi:RcnB family protein [Sodalis sp. dw_96]|uniref:RcnB family protein n=1 Tax=Sodalis sp. dw_96 TaxID=2719794 RepID=UPI001BD67F0C|nr:RcnB family protein [Sodalis sp. dw_96]